MMLILSGNSTWEIPSGKELYDSLRNELARILKRKVASIEQVKLRLWDIAQVCLRTLDGEEGIVLSPHDQSLRLLVPKEFMPAVIERKIRLIVVKQVELDDVIAWAIEKELIYGV
jgi:hypothetical protein